MSARTPEPCDGITGGHTGPVRFYRTGWKCPAHSPSAEAGLPEPLPGPGMPHGARIPSLLADSALFDNRAIASGKRRSSPQAYRAAQDAVDHREPT
mgnify:CR=1 FL=1